jgi:hypothetical protein
MKRRRRHMVRKKKGELKAVDIKRTGIRIRNPDPESRYAIGKMSDPDPHQTNADPKHRRGGKMVGKKKGKLKAVDNFRMALKYETMTEEERRADRLDRYRWREGWERDTIERRFCYTTATVVARAIEEQEDSVLKVAAADFAGKDAVLQGIRRTATDLQKVYLQLETASKYDLKIAEKFFDRKSSVQGLTDEQEKLLNKIIKEESGESSGSKGKKRKIHDGKEELRGDNSQAGGPGPGAGPGWGFAPAFPYGPFMGNFAAGFSSIMMGGGAAPSNMGYGSGGYGGGGQFGMHGQQGHNQQGGGYGYGGTGGGDYGGPSSSGGE